MLLSLSIAHTTASSRMLLPLIFFTVIICILYRRSFSRGIRLIGITVIGLAAFALIIRLMGYSVSFVELGVGYLRLISLATLSVVLLLSMNSLQVITSLSYFRLPLGIALAVGVGLRFLPVFVEEARRIKVIRRHRTTINRKSAGVVERLDEAISPFIVSVLRRVDLLVLSIAIQQLEERIKCFRMPRFRSGDWIALFITASLLGASFIL